MNTHLRIRACNASDRSLTPHSRNYSTALARKKLFHPDFIVRRAFFFQLACQYRQFISLVKSTSAASVDSLQIPGGRACVSLTSFLILPNSLRIQILHQKRKGWEYTYLDLARHINKLYQICLFYSHYLKLQFGCNSTEFCRCSLC